MKTPDSSHSNSHERQCCCGGSLADFGHPLCENCQSCGTQVLRRDPTEAELKAFNGCFPDDKFVVGRRKGEAQKISSVNVTAAPAENLAAAKRILFVRTDSIGDAVLASSMIEPLHKQFPEAQLAVLCQTHVAELFAACPFIHSVICYDRKQVESNLGERTQILNEIKAFQPDVVLNSVRSRDQFSDEKLNKVR